MLQKRKEKTADSQINFKSANLRFHITHKFVTLKGSLQSLRKMLSA